MNLKIANMAYEVIFSLFTHCNYCVMHCLVASSVTHKELNTHYSCISQTHGITHNVFRKQVYKKDYDHVVIMR